MEAKEGLCGPAGVGGEKEENASLKAGMHGKVDINPSQVPDSTVHRERLTGHVLCTL